MAQIAKASRVYHSGYAEIILPREGEQCNGSCDPCEPVSCPVFGRGSRRAVAENAGDVKWGDLVEVSPIGSAAGSAKWTDWAVYIIPIAAFILGCVIGRAHEQSLEETLLSGLMLGALVLVIVWMLDRGSRLGRRLEYRVVRVVKER